MLKRRLKAVANHVAFFCRQSIRWSRQGYTEAVHDNLQHHMAQDDIQAQAMFRTLCQHYPRLLDYAQHGMSLTRWRENLNYLAMLHQAQPTLRRQKHKANRDLRVLEIGIKNWSTLPALLSFLHAHPAQNIHLDGVEVDLWRLYANGHSRYDALQYHLKQAQRVSQNTWQNSHIRVIEDDIQNMTPPADGQGYDLILWSLPFVSQETHLAWGLPETFFGPEARLKHVSRNLLSQHGHLISTHQGWDESEHQQALSHLAGLVTYHQDVCQQPFLAWQYPRILHVSQKARITDAFKQNRPQQPVLKAASKTIETKAYANAAAFFSI